MNRWIRRFFALTLFAYPRDFREQYRASMYEHFEAEGGGWSGALRTSADVVRTAISMHVENLWRDITYALRMNVKAPLFSVVVLGTIALAIAANAVVFSLLDAVLLKPLPYAQPEQLGFVWAREPGLGGDARTALSLDDIRALRRATRAFRSVTGSMSQDVQDPSGVRMLKDQIVLPNYFQTLGVRPLIGRFLSGDPGEVVISYDLWRSRFGGDAAVLGERFRAGANTYTIVGVAPQGVLDPSYGSLERTDFWTAMPRTGPAKGLTFVVFPIVRLRDGLTWDAAQADLRRITPVLHAAEVHTLTRGSAIVPGITYYTGSLGDQILGAAKQYLWIVFAAVSAVLLIACTNVANLLLARGAARDGEFAVRRSVGASPRRVASQMFVEVLLLAATGSVAGIAIAYFVLPWAKATMPQTFPRLQSATIDTRVLVYVCLLTLAVAFIAGMLPAYRTAAGRDRHTAGRFRVALIVVEIAVAFALATGSGLLLRSFVTLTSQDVGFNPHGIYAATVLPKSGFVSITLRDTHPQVAMDLVRRLREIPGVAGAAVTTSVPFQNDFMMSVMYPGRGSSSSGYKSMISANGAQVTESYFRLMQIPLVQGREFTGADFTGRTEDIVVNQAFARKYFPRSNPIGQTIGSSESRSRIVGIVGDTRTTLKQPPQPTVYMPFNGGFGPLLSAVYRLSRPVPSLTREVTAILQQVDPEGATPRFDSLDDLVAKDASTMRTSLELLASLALVALLLGLSGIYSVVAYGTERRFHEIGIRMAVGARPGDILGLILKSAAAQAVLGITFGVLLSAFTTGFLSSQLYKTSPLDPLTFIAVVAIMAACAVGAAVVPAGRAAAARPSSTLRYE